MNPDEPVPEADRLEQEEPRQAEPRLDVDSHGVAPEADVLEQEVPVGDEPPPSVFTGDVDPSVPGDAAEADWLEQEEDR
ncbi:MAG TPA: hypothetical protein VKG43_05010 [Acidimicrobiales bacterium]|nr:hypothetical protein [Acidimicrobiales bacterium]